MVFDWSEPCFRHALDVISRLRECGFEAYIVGGAVRDALLGRSPQRSEIDVVTSATPGDIARLFERVVPVGAEFLVVRVLIGETEIETATFRSEASYADGRHPDAVRPGTLEEDAARRDFTINGLYYDPFRDEVIDLVSGRDDLARRIIRTIGEPEKRFAEDHLRMLRAIRFAVTLEFDIHPPTYEAIRAHAADIQSVSQERIRDELVKMLVPRQRARGLRMLKDTGLLHFIIPELEPMEGCKQPPNFHPEGDVWVHTLLALEALSNPTPELALGTLLHDVGKPETITFEDRIRFNNHDAVGAAIAERVCRRLRFSNEQVEHIKSLVASHMRFLSAQKMSLSKLKRLLRLDRVEEHLELSRVDCVASHGDLSIYNFCRQKLSEFSAEELRPPKLLDGYDLIALGFEPGPIFSRILERIEEAQLAGEVTTRDQAAELVRREFAAKP